MASTNLDKKWKTLTEQLLNELPKAITEVPDGFATVKQIENQLGISERLVYRKLQKHNIKYIRVKKNKHVPACRYYDLREIIKKKIFNAG